MIVFFFFAGLLARNLHFGDHPSNWVPLEVKLDVHVLALGQHAMYNNCITLTNLEELSFFCVLVFPNVGNFIAEKT